jgi:DNA-binding transcriptional ArsR family regulator
MARSKARLFEDDEQLASQLCHGMAHPARVRILSRLVNGQEVDYTSLLSGMPLDQKSCMQHINILRRLNFLEPALLHTKRGGYRLNMDLYQSCTAATRRLLRVEGRVRLLGIEVEDEAV